MLAKSGPQPVLVQQTKQHESLPCFSDWAPSLLLHRFPVRKEPVFFSSFSHEEVKSPAKSPPPPECSSPYPLTPWASLHLAPLASLVETRQWDSRPGRTGWELAGGGGGTAPVAPEILSRKGFGLWPG